MGWEVEIVSSHSAAFCHLTEKALWGTQARPSTLNCVSISLVTSQSQALRWEYDLELTTEILILYHVLFVLQAVIYSFKQKYFVLMGEIRKSLQQYTVQQIMKKKTSPTTYFFSLSLCFVIFGFKTSLWEFLQTSVMHLDIYHYVIHIHIIHIKLRLNITVDITKSTSLSLGSGESIIFLCNVYTGPLSHKTV